MINARGERERERERERQRQSRDKHETQKKVSVNISYRRADRSALLFYDRDYNGWCFTFV